MNIDFGTYFQGNDMIDKVYRVNLQDTIIWIEVLKISEEDFDVVLSDSVIIEKVMSGVIVDIMVKVNDKGVFVF